MHPQLTVYIVCWELSLCISSSCKLLEPKLCLEPTKSLWHISKVHILCFINYLRTRTQNVVVHPKAKYQLLRLLT